MERSARKRPAPVPQDEHSKRIFRNTLQGQSAWDRHKNYVARYLQFYERDGGKARQDRLDVQGRNDWDVLRENHRFLRDDDDATADDGGAASTSTSATKEYELEVARRYYKHLFKEFAIADMKHYKTGDIALRWRSEEDVIDGIGQFTCANTRCEHHRRLQSPSVALDPYEVNFAYQEASSSKESAYMMKNALVKVVLCLRCARKLRYKSDKEKGTDRRSPSSVRKWPR